MDDQTAIDVHERGKYSEDHREHRDGDGDASKGSPVEHDATLTDRWERDAILRHLMSVWRIPAWPGRLGVRIGCEGFGSS